ncbi:uncharacterized protein N7477_000345 [Penicillium maclennaniae]|uniref:uncharacterized protein n=1 Tax=Penicillium maclennaniae TaxID=1343394 RepID=UPI00254263F7|nr:uncharacterized protein N7477_000345 [Penicillium maclennaniae]KAJ5684000.1 hypothetical protein N7477_000345 [Penicillium maclennaniae]
MASIQSHYFYTEVPGQSDEYVDFDQFLDFTSVDGDISSASANSVSPEMALPYDADMFGDDLLDFTQPTFPDMFNYELSQDAFLDQSTEMGLMQGPAPVFDDVAFHGYQPYDFRQMVEAQAAADPRIVSTKEKRREASIALHLQRLCDATALDLEMSSDSSASFSSQSWSDCMRESISPKPISTSTSTRSTPVSSQEAGGMEMVLDLNMNAASNLPKKQKPRSQAQKENYIKARKYGACEKHKKQHKRVSHQVVPFIRHLTCFQCNCLEKAAARAGVNEVPMDVSYREQPRPQQTVLPGTHPYSLPGHEPTVISPSLRPTAKMIKKLKSTHSPRYDSSLCTSALQQSVKTKTNVDSVAGHSLRNITNVSQSSVKDRQHVPSSPSHVSRKTAILDLSPIRDRKHAHNSSGLVLTSQSPTMPPSLRTLRSSVGQQVSWFSALGSTPASNSVRSSESKSTKQVMLRTNRSDTGTVRAPNLEVRRPRQTTVSRQVKDESTSPTASLMHTQSLRRFQNRGALAVSNLTQRPVVLEGSRLPSAILTTGLQSPGSTGSSGLFGQSAAMVRCFVAQMGEVFATNVLAFAGAWRSSLPFTTWLEDVTYKGLSLGGWSLMSAKKGLQLHSMRTFWSA